MKRTLKALLPIIFLICSLFAFSVMAEAETDVASFGNAKFSYDKETKELTVGLADGKSGWQELIVNPATSDTETASRTIVDFMNTDDGDGAQRKANIKKVTVNSFNKFQIRGDRYCLFDGMTALEEVAFKNGLRIQVNQGSGEVSLFKGCANLKTVYFGSTNNREVGTVNFTSSGNNAADSYHSGFKNMFSGCSSIEKIILPAYVATSTGNPKLFESTFEGCTSLTSVTVGGTLFEIESLDIFKDSPIETITADPGCEVYLTAIENGLVTLETALSERKTALSLTAISEGYVAADATVDTEADTINWTPSNIRWEVYDIGTEAFPMKALYFYIDSSVADNADYTASTVLKSVKNLAMNGGTYSGLGDGQAKNGGAWVWQDLVYENRSGAYHMWNNEDIDVAQINKIVIGDGITESSNDGSLFAGMTGVDTIEFPESFKEMKRTALKGCTSLETVYTRDVGQTPIKGTANFSNFTDLPFDNESGFAGLRSIKQYIWGENLVISGSGSYIFYNNTSLTALVLPEGVTACGKEYFKNCPELTTITFPENLTEVKASAFTNSSKLQSVTFLGDTALYAAEGAETKADVTAAATGNTFYGCTNLTYIYSPIFSQPCAFACKYGFSENDTAGIHETVITTNGNVHKAVYDHNTGHLDYLYVSSDSNWNYWVDWTEQPEVTEYFDSIRNDVVSITVGKFYKLQGKGTWFGNMPKLEWVNFASNQRISMNAEPSTGLFANCSNLNTVWFGSEADRPDEGTVDFTGLNQANFDGSHRLYSGMFSGCEGIKSVILSKPLVSGSNITTLHSDTFTGCTNLEKVTVPEGAGIIYAIENGAFDGLNNLKYLFLKGDGYADTAEHIFPDTEGLKIYTTSSALKNGAGEIGKFADNYSLTELVAVVDTVKATGFSIRTTEKNGLRSLFSFDDAYNKTLSANGVELIEYGGILVPSNKLAELGDDFKINVVRQNGTCFVNTASAVKIPIMSNGVLVGKKLSSSKENIKSDFAVTLVNYTNNFTNKIYACAYSVYKDSFGNEYVEISNYGDTNSELEENSITSVAVSMYTNYPKSDKYEALLAGTFETSPVWNVLYQAASGDFETLGDGVYAMTVLNTLNDTEYRIIAAATREAAQAKRSSENDICIAVSDIEEKYNTVEKKSDTAPAARYETVTTPVYSNDIDFAQHPQGMASDGTHLYVSFTGMISKVNIATGEEVGVYRTGLGESFHMGDLTYHNGYLYGSLTGWGVDHVFIGVIKCDDLVGDKGDEILKIAHFFEIDSSEANYGFGGIDGIAVGKIPGQGYIDANNVEHTDNNTYLLVAVGGGVRADNTTARDFGVYDNDNYKICAVNFNDVLDNAVQITSDLFKNATGLTSITPVHNMYTYIGACRYGPQTMEVDKATGDIILNMYNRPSDSVYPKTTGNTVVIDGQTKLKLEEIEVGQSVPESSPNYDTAHARAEKYLVDGKYPTGYFVTLKCKCGLNDIEAHAPQSYGDTGKEFRFCNGGSGSTLDLSKGMVAAGNDLFYVLDYKSNATDGTKTGYQATVTLYRLNHYEGAWTYTKYTNPTVE